MTRIPADGISSIIIRTPNWLGDAVMCLPALDCIIAGFPGSRVSVLTKPGLELLFEGNARIDSVIPLSGKGVGGFLKAVSVLKSRGFDMAVLFPNSFGSALMAALSRIRTRVGYATDGRGFLLTHPVPKDAVAGHQTEYYLDIARSIVECEGAAGIEVKVSKNDRERAAGLLESCGLKPSGDEKLVAVAPGATYGEAKRWPAERFAGVIRRIRGSRLARVIVLGTQAEAGIAEKACSGSDALNLCGRTDLRQLAGVLSLCNLLVTNDTGTMHLASAAGTKVVAIFGSTDEKMTGPAGKSRIIKGGADCAPCFKRTCDRGLVCMLAVGEDEVFNTVREELGASRG